MRRLTGTGGVRREAQGGAPAHCEASLTCQLQAISNPIISAAYGAGGMPQGAEGMAGGFPGAGAGGAGAHADEPSGTSDFAHAAADFRAVEEVD